MPDTGGVGCRGEGAAFVDLARLTGEAGRVGELEVAGALDERELGGVLVDVMRECDGGDDVV